MRRLLTFVLPIFFTLITVRGAANQIDAGLIARWSFEESDGSVALDAISQFNGAVVNATRVPGRVGTRALQFNGVNSYVLIGGEKSALQLTNINFSITWWGKWGGPTPTPQDIIAMDDGADYSGGYQLWLAQNGALNVHATSEADAWLNLGLLGSDWTFFALTSDGTSRRFYVNGNLLGSRPISAPLRSDGDDPLVFGAIRFQNGEFNYFYKGALDEIRLYNRALSADDILALNQPSALNITRQPRAAAVASDDPFTISVEASAFGSPITYQWELNQIPIANETNSSLTTTISKGTNYYRVLVKTADLQIYSDEVAISVLGLENALLAQWSFDENDGALALDSISGFNGTISNATRIAGRVGTGALQFNGTNSYVLIGGERSPLQLTNTAFTISWWQRWDGPNGTYQDVIAMDDGADFSGGYQIWLSQNPSALNLHATSQADAWYSFATPVNSWTFYVLTSDGITRRIYANSALIGARPIAQPLGSDGDDPLVFGALRGQDGKFLNFFNGALDDVRIYRRSLSASEVISLGPPPVINVNEQPVGYRIGVDDTVTLSVAASLDGTGGPLRYQWERNRTPINDATNANLTATGISGTNYYRVSIKSDTLQLYSDEVPVETVFPTDARLLLHLDFEETKNGTFADSAGGLAGISGNAPLVPGRVGVFAADFDGSTYIRIPAAGSDLELVGTSYTIACWIKARPSNDGSTQTIFTMDRPDQNLTGYSAELTGPPFSRTLVTEHRNGITLPASSIYRGDTNWQHIAVVFNGVSRNVFINGIDTGSPAPTLLDIIGTGHNDLFLGSVSETQFSPVGALDDFRVYNYALTTDEIQALVNIPAPSTLVSIQQSWNEVILKWPASDGAFYRVEYTDHLPAISWVPVSATIQLSGYYNLLKIPASPAAARFYRVRKL